MHWQGEFEIFERGGKIANGQSKYTVLPENPLIHSQRKKQETEGVKFAIKPL